MKYVCSYEYFPNCRVCDSGFSRSDLLFFNSIKEILKYAWDMKDDTALGTIYSTKGKELFDINYEGKRHQIIDVFTNIKGLKLNVVDDGHGNKVWKRYE